MATSTSMDQCRLWRTPQFFDMELAQYTLQHHNFPRHFHNYYVIELVVSGLDRFYCQGQHYTASANHLVLINPGEVHTGSTVDDTILEYYSLYPDVKTLQEISEILEPGISLPVEFPEKVVADPELANRLLQLFRQRAILSKREQSLDKLKEEELFFECMSLLLKHRCTNALPAATKPGKDTRVNILLDYLHTHFREDISLQQLASLVCLNPYHVIRIFKAATSLSPYDYLINLRIEYAKGLLRKNYSIREVSRRAGFYDASHLNRLFKKTVGASPKCFRS